MKAASKWIWPVQQAEPDQYGEFYHAFEYQGQKAQLLISADSNYAAYINGHLAAFGQYGDYPHRKVYSTHDVTSFCRCGKNTLLVTAWHWGLTTFSHYPQPAGLYYQLTTGCHPLAVSGVHTLCRRNPHYTSHREKQINWILGYSYRYNAAGAETPWHPAVARPDITPLYPSLLPIWSCGTRFWAASSAAMAAPDFCWI